jgi:ABC-2 type transport system permease protein
MNFYGTLMLFYKEVMRFLSVFMQTILAPVINAVLFLIVFYPFGEQMTGFGFSNVDYGLFLIPGLLMMSVLQNAFANSSSSMIQAKNYGNVIFMLVAPLSSFEIMLAFVAGAIVRGILVALAVYLVGGLFYEINIVHPLATFALVFLSSLVMGAMGLIAGIWADRYDHLAGFQNFVILPLTFLSGVFYSTQNLPEIWYQISLWNPFFYMIDALRFSILGQSDIDIFISIWAIICFAISTCLCAWWMLHTGYRLRH